MALIELRISGRRLSLRGLLDGLAKRRGLARSRRALARLDAHLLRDIGISAGAARREAERPVWDVPQTWIRL